MNDVLVNQYSLENKLRRSGCWRRVEQVQHSRKDTGGEQVILGGRERHGPSGDSRSPLPAEVEALLGSLYTWMLSHMDNIYTEMALFYGIELCLQYSSYAIGYHVSCLYRPFFSIPSRYSSAACRLYSPVPAPCSNDSINASRMACGMRPDDPQIYTDPSRLCRSS